MTSPRETVGRQALDLNPKEAESTKDMETASVDAGTWDTSAEYF